MVPKKTQRPKFSFCSNFLGPNPVLQCLCIAYIAILTLFCVRLNVTPKTVFWLFNSFQLVFIDIFHGLVIPWRMKIPWRTLQQKERPSQFYVLKPPELRIGRFDKMATQRPAPPPPPPSSCSSSSPPPSPSPSLIFNSVDFVLCHPHCPDSPERGWPRLEPNFRKLSLGSSEVSLPIIPISAQSPQLESPSSFPSSPAPNLPLSSSPLPHPDCPQECRRTIPEQPRHRVFSPVSINSLSLPPSLNSVTTDQGCSFSCLADSISSSSSPLPPISQLALATPPLPEPQNIHSKR